MTLITLKDCTVTGYVEGMEVYWLTSGYGHNGKVPSKIIRVSITGKRVRIAATMKNGMTFTTYVKPENLIKREAP